MPVAAIFLAALVAQAQDSQPKLEARRIDDATLEIRREGQEAPLLVFHAGKEERPYIHPLVAPDGRGELTEFSPGHHPHQTGLYVGFLKVNGRDFFHNRGAGYFRRLGASSTDADAAPARVEGRRAAWEARYEWLDQDGRTILAETQRWTLIDQGDSLVLDLDWLGQAAAGVEFGQHEYGGLFVRMPWRAETGGEAVNSEAEVNAEAEGRRARWVDVGVPIEGRDDPGHIAILDHPDNPGHPATWRVDDQLGFGPAPGRRGPWRIDAGRSARLRYRIVAYTGGLSRDLVETEWERFKAEP
jgi:hypothetical protein